MFRPVAALCDTSRMLPTLLAIAAIVAYLVAAARIVWPNQQGDPRLQRLALVVAALASLAHATLLFGLHRGALDLHFYAALSLVGFGVVALTLLVNLFRPVAGLGVIVFPLAAILLAIDVFVGPPTQPSSLDWQIRLHV
ncbi:MAG: inner membrane protein YpjD, partial [Dokdonella sp.]